jgi:hypothetical protein
MQYKHLIPPLLSAALFVASGSQAASLTALSDQLYDRYEIEMNGFAETRWGLRLVDDATQDTLSLGEARLQVQMQRHFDSFFVEFKGDIWADAVMEELNADIRDLSLSFRPNRTLDFKVGRTVSTWGTGDLIFINDLFPKDWQAFFIGRDDEYLKRASNVIRTGIFLENYSIDIIYTPLFEGSQYVKGERLSYYHPGLGHIVGQNFIMADEERNRFFRDDEWALRFSTRVEGVELALYGYSGFWQEPEGMDPFSQKATYPPLRVFGASARSALLGGIGHMELGYYDSTDDEGGRNPLVRPSEYRFLVGFERELAHELIGGLQYYVEHIDKHEDYRQHLPAGMPVRDEYRHLLTLRLTQLLMNQNLILSFFAYYSPSDRDGFLRPKVTYKVNDDWQVDGGLNLFFGKEEHTFWGRFQDNTNAFVGLRYSF